MNLGVQRPSHCGITGVCRSNVSSSYSSQQGILWSHGNRIRPAIAKRLLIASMACVTVWAILGGRLRSWGELCRYLCRRSGGFLRDGSGLAGLRQALQIASGGSILCHPCQTREERSARIFSQDRPNCWSGLRSVDSTQRILREPRLPRTFAVHPLQRSRIRQKHWYF